jgi:hypothetical protein
MAERGARSAPEKAAMTPTAAAPPAFGVTVTEGETSSVLRHLIRGGDLSAWGLANAVTRTAEDVADYDRATELEAAGGRVIELSPSDWRVLAA